MKKRIAFLAQEEPFFIPTIFQILIENLTDRLVGAGFFPSAPSSKSFKREYIDRYQYYGPMAFTKIGFSYLMRRTLNPSLKSIAQKNNIPFIEWDSGTLKDPLVLKKLQELNLDVLLILGNQIVNNDLLTVAKMGCFNIHPAPLPKDRGREPVFYALHRGEKEVGVTVHQMVKELDAGDIYKQTKIPVENSDTVLGLTKKIWIEGANLFCQMIKDIEGNTFSLHAQDETKATYNTFPNKQMAKEFRLKGGRFI